MPLKTFYLADNLPYEFHIPSSTDVSEPLTLSAATERSFNGDSFIDCYDKEFLNLSELVSPNLSGSIIGTPNKNKIEEEIRKYLICHTYETNTTNEGFITNPFFNGNYEKSTNSVLDDVVEANRFFPTRTSLKVRTPSVIDSSGVNCFTGRGASSVGQCAPAAPVQSRTEPYLPSHLTTFLSPTFSFSKSDNDPPPRSIASAIKRRHIRRPTSIRYSSYPRGFTLARSKDGKLMWKKVPTAHSRYLNYPLVRTIPIASGNQTSETPSSISIIQDSGEQKILTDFSTVSRCSSKVSRKSEKKLSIEKWQKEGRLNYRSIASAIARESRVKPAKVIKARRTPRLIENRTLTHSDWPRRSYSFVHTCTIPRSAKCPICEEDEPELLYKFQFRPKRMCLCRRERRLPRTVRLEADPPVPSNNLPVEKYSDSFRFTNNRSKSRYKCFLKHDLGLTKNANSGKWKNLVAQKSGTGRSGESSMSLTAEEARFLHHHQFDDILSDFSYSATLTRSSSDIDSAGNCSVCK